MNERQVNCIDVAANRRAQNYSRLELLRRMAWGGMAPLFRLSPRIFFGWRRFLLRLFGATIGKEVHVYPTARIVMPWNLVVGDWSCIGEESLIYALGKVTIGTRTTISQRTHLCAGSHDYRRADLPLLKLPITIGSEAWICADAFVGPGVHVGEGAVVGARGVVVQDVPPWTVVAGNPARFISVRQLKEGES
jgi:putative colanic acid biosynthesis acetyltransferase WcaF